MSKTLILDLPEAEKQSKEKRKLLCWTPCISQEQENRSQRKHLGTSVRRSSRSAFGRSTGNDVSGHYKRHYFLFFFLFFSFLLRRLLFSQKECSDQKTYLAKVDGSAPKPRGRHLSRPRRPFWGPLAAILDFEASDWSKYGLLGSKNLFSESCSQRPYYYREVISVF